MKIACYILSFYFIVLSGMACADTVPQRDSSENITVVNTADNNHDHDHNQGWDGCSPLCVCHCCHLHFFPVSDAAISQPEKLPMTYSAYIQDFRSIEIFDFLIPPRS
ncbi:MAG: hypothetical protein RLO12_01595 [Fulvivirga sp.]